jgi:hypothetical protein
MLPPSYFLGSQRIDQLHREADQVRLARLARLARRQRQHVVVQTRCTAVPGRFPARSVRPTEQGALDMELLLLVLVFLLYWSLRNHGDRKSAP